MTVFKMRGIIIKMSICGKSHLEEEMETEKHDGLVWDHIIPNISESQTSWWCCLDPS